MANLTHDPVREISEIRNQLSYAKRIGFLFGAGSSKAVGISDIAALTQKVGNEIKESKKDFAKLKCGSDGKQSLNIEQILNDARLIRQITNDRKDKNYEGISGDSAKNLDIEVCNKIYEIISAEEKSAELNSAKQLMTWLNYLSRDFPKEIFTTNYDLIFEKALEGLQIPYFDGFVGANEPFFVPESLDSDSKYDRPPTAWLRLWKIHGSLGWFWKAGPDAKSYKIIRLSAEAKSASSFNELVIYPSKEKYESSRKQPFIAYFDRLRNFLQEGEGLFIVSGYSFSDEHINAVIFDSIRQNNRLHVLSFFFTDQDVEQLHKKSGIFPNVTAIGPKRAIVKGSLGDWRKTKNEELLDAFWDAKTDSLKLGDFKELVKFLVLTSGKRERIETDVITLNGK